ncbi:electron transfer flavoprotein subunit alpha/FixB family protein [Halalkalicoccus jeotgali]|uniref:Electron transfer flavoprotein alpha subunit n=1 Tax=Halalkalicoccus jeotgali (strain DSM 18796 / CECT 7217 / JCM 14584 / KCTC 4019 / B3) TaxID=795797 RepID=D8JCU4_HALJB|nr:electron transfer flavoprotein subunit alpha/FixB family protein [Halalkalicoccus jeotgali]ADJ16839.1 electron transfer flavoprotein alpha subunit [Halalkalicoccus jeotgali B3]ELY38725.1 electron transfer flavoprotein subunit alpha [Halalkalicoccus jeotgali B3]
MTSVLAIAEHRRGELRDVSDELISAGRELADDLSGELHIAVISGQVEEFARTLSREGVDVVHTVAAGSEFNHDIYVQAVERLTAELDPSVVLMPNSVNGLDYGPAVANRLDRPLVTDVVGASFEDGFVATREMYGSKVETTVEVDAERVTVMIRGGEWPGASGNGDTEIRETEIEIDESAVHTTVTGFEEVGGGDVDISDAEVLVSVGRGIEEEANIELIEELADALDATLSSSRPIVDNGWLPKNRQVGQSGKTVTPEVYIAIGISGAVQHVAGMKGSETIVAINTDPNAPIFDIADYGIVDDLFDVVPALIAEFE